MIVIKELTGELFIETASMITELMSYHSEINKSKTNYYKPHDQSFKSLTNWCHEGLVYNIFSDHKIVGFLYVKVGNQEVAQLEEIYIKSLYRNEGIGKKALRKLDKVLAQKGISALVVNVSPRNSKAIKFYQECGFDHLNLLQIRKNLDNKLDKHDHIEILGFNFKRF